MIWFWRPTRLSLVYNSKTYYQNSKIKKTLSVIYLIRKHFNREELRTIITSNYYSVLYYNSEIWHLPSLTQTTKNSNVGISGPTEIMYTIVWSKYVVCRFAHNNKKSHSPANDEIQIGITIAQPLQPGKYERWLAKPLF